jgi:hypothetical protein
LFLVAVAKPIMNARLLSNCAVSVAGSTVAGDGFIQFPTRNGRKK